MSPAQNVLFPTEGQSGQQQLQHKYDTHNENGGHYRKLQFQIMRKIDTWSDSDGNHLSTALASQRLTVTKIETRVIKRWAIWKCVSANANLVVTMEVTPTANKSSP